MPTQTACGSPRDGTSCTWPVAVSWVSMESNDAAEQRGSFLNSYVSPGTFWQNVVPRGTVSATKWTFITSSAVPHREGDVPEHLARPSTMYVETPPPRSSSYLLWHLCAGSFLWLAQSRKDLFCVWDQDGQLRPSSVPLPSDVKTHFSSSRWTFFDEVPVSSAVDCVYSVDGADPTGCLL